MAVRVISIAPRREINLAELASEFSTRAVLRKMWEIPTVQKRKETV